MAKTIKQIKKEFKEGIKELSDKHGATISIIDSDGKEKMKLLLRIKVVL